MSIIVSPLFVPVVLQKPIFMIANPEAETISLILKLAHLVSIKYQGQFSWIWKTINFECFCNWGPKLRQRCKPERRDAQNCNVNTLETLFSALQTLLSLRCTARHCTVPFQLPGIELKHSPVHFAAVLCPCCPVQCTSLCWTSPKRTALHLPKGFWRFNDCCCCAHVYYSPPCFKSPDICIFCVRHPKDQGGPGTSGVESTLLTWIGSMQKMLRRIVWLLRKRYSGDFPLEKRG